MNRPGTKCSQTVQGQNLHRLFGDKIKCLIIGHSMKFKFKFQLTFLGSCNLTDYFVSIIFCKVIATIQLTEYVAFQYIFFKYIEDDF